MLHRFATYEQAALFAAMKRDEGYYAEVLHDHVASLWGPLATGGVAVWVSEVAAVGEGDEEPGEEARTSWLPAELSEVLGSTVLSIVGLVALVGVLVWLRRFAIYTREMIQTLASFAIAFGLFAVLVSVLGWACSRWLHRLWNERDTLHPLASGLHRALAVLLVLCSTLLGEILLFALFEVFSRQ